MSLVYRNLFPAMWLSWAAYWWLASRGAKPAERREPSVAMHSLIAVAGIIPVSWWYYFSTFSAEDPLEIQ